MNIAEAAVVIRQRGLLEVFDLAIRFSFGIGGRLYLRLMAWFLAPAFLVCGAVLYLLDAGWVAVILALALGGLLQGVFTIAAGQLMFAPSVKLSEVTAQYWKRFVPYLGALLVARIVLALSALLILLPPLVLVRSAYLHEALLLEGARVGEGGRRAARFGSQDWGHTLGLVVCSVCLSGFVAGATVLVVDSVVNDVLQLGQPYGPLRGSGGFLLGMLGYFLSIPLVATARFLAYIDARTRRDGWDIQVRFMAVQAQEKEQVAT